MPLVKLQAASMTSRKEVALSHAEHVLKLNAWPRNDSKLVRRVSLISCIVLRPPATPIDLLRSRGMPTVALQAIV